MLLLAAAVVAALVDWWAVPPAARDLERWLKPLTMALLVAVAATAGDLDGAGRVLLVVGAVFGLVGDVALLGDGERRSWRASARSRSATSRTSAPRSPSVRAGLGAARGRVHGWRCSASGSRPARCRVHGAQGGAVLAGAVVFYACVISAMVITAWATTAWVAAVGAMLFAVSDWVLGHQRFVGPLPGGRLAVMVPYHVGQALLIVGLATASSGRLPCRTDVGLWVFGYGSLVSPESFGRTLGRELVPGIDFFEAELTGFGRRWNYGVMHSTGRLGRRRRRRARPHDRRARARRVDGGVGERRGRLGRRRRADRSRPARASLRPRSTSPPTTTVHTDHTIDGSIMVYVPKPESIEHYERPATAGAAAVDRGYWDRVDAAFAALGADRTPRYHAARRHRTSRSLPLGRR